jgi:hypothetical protein
MSKLQIDLSGIKGLTNHYYGDKPYASSKPNLRYFGNQGEVAEGIYNPIALLGYMSPANNTTKTVTGTSGFLLTSALITRRITSTTTDAIFFSDEATTGTSGKVLNLDTAVDTALDTAYTIDPFSGTPYFKCTDMIVYQINGVSQIFFSSINITSTGNNTIGIADTGFGSPDVDWSTTLPVGASDFIKGDTSGAPTAGRLSFVNADNGFLYILNGNNIHKVDGGITGGTNGTVTPRVLTFLGDPTSGGTATVTRLIEAVDTRGRLWIGLHVDAADSTPFTENFNRRVGVYVWDRRSTVANMQDFISIEGVKEFKSMFMFQGQPACFTLSNDGYTQFRVWNGNEFKVVKTLGKEAYPPYKRHSMHVEGDLVYWLGNDGYVYCYGKIIDGLGNGLYIVGDMTAHVTSNQTFTGGGILIAANDVETVTSGTNTNGLAFYISFKDTAGNHLKKFYVHGIQTIASNNQVAHIGNIYSMVNFLPDMTNLEYIDIRCAPTGSGSSTIATIKYYANQSTTPFATKTITQDQASRGYVRHELNKHYVNAFQMEIEHAIDITMGDNSFRPSTAILEYKETQTKG